MEQMDEYGKHQKLIEAMTREEKASLMSGDNFWNSKSIKRLGIPSMMLVDGPHGVRKQGGKADHLGLNKSIPATCFPTAATLANSWDVDLITKVGESLGKEAVSLDVQVLLGPGLNIKRNPLAGRNFEYFSEDPYLTGKLAAAMVKGIQSQGISACPKHFAVNSQETRRMIVDEIVDERALHEIYLEAFRYVVQEAKPYCMMTSYNKLNGEYTNENKYLLQDILVKKWGYKGALVTDWGGNNNRVKGLIAGNTLEMPSTYGMTDQEIVSAIEDKNLDEMILDQQVDKLLTLIDKTKNAPKPQGNIQEQNHAMAIEAACRSIVLLKNQENLLPLTNRKQKVAVIGDFAENPRYQGAGSSLIVPTQMTNLYSALKERGFARIAYEQGFKRFGGKSIALSSRAIRLAKLADVVFLFLGLDEGSEAEGVDRRHMRINKNQLELAGELMSVSRKVVVILAGGAPIELPFAPKAAAILHGYLPGQGGGEALVKVLTGERTPSGKLAETYPISYKDVVSSAYFPGEILTSEHRESIFTGYRQFEYEGKKVRYPFGYGLSYTTFEYSNLRIGKIQQNIPADPVVMQAEVMVTVTNTGEYQGEEIVQIYIAPKNRLVFHEKKSLKGFAKVALKPGESKEVTIGLDSHGFAYYHIKRNRWVIEEGCYEILAGASSQDIRLKVSVEIEGEKAENPYRYMDIKAYWKKKLDLSSEDFETLLCRKLPPSQWNTKKALGRQDLLEQCRYGGNFGKLVYGLIIGLHKFWKLTKNPILYNNILFVLGMPFRGVARMSGGRVNMEMLNGLIQMMDHHFWRGLYKLIKEKCNYEQKKRH